MKKDYIAPEINIIHFKNGDVMMSSSGNGSYTCNNGDADGDNPSCSPEYGCSSDCVWHSGGCSSDCEDCEYCPNDT